MIIFGVFDVFRGYGMTEEGWWVLHRLRLFFLVLSSSSKLRILLDLFFIRAYCYPFFSFQLWDSLAWRLIRMGRRREEKKWSPDDDEDAWVLWLWWVEGDDDDDGVSDNDDDLTPATAREVDAGSWEVGMLQMGIMMIDRCEECVKNGNRNDSKQVCRLDM